MKDYTFTQICLIFHFYAFDTFVPVMQQADLVFVIFVKRLINVDGACTAEALIKRYLIDATNVYISSEPRDFDIVIVYLL
ncbi:hypothetical protein HanIR_Chr14g0702561 [Helianthus annuus]|nr:hypothetical protein HanIR_Chr14g0702561 [Helianthus annuus]